MWAVERLRAIPRVINDGSPMLPEQRPDSLALLLEQERGRVQGLLGVRHTRMAVSPFTYFRGAAVVMASDLAREGHSGLTVQLCGDAHLLNFGFYASPERQLLFDINDFDETYPGPYEWDVIRLMTSLLLAARSNGLSSKDQEAVCLRGARAYADAMAEFAKMPFLSMWSCHLSKGRLSDRGGSKNLREHLKGVVAAALKRDSRQAAKKLCEVVSEDQLRFKNNPPLVWRAEELPESWRDKLDWDEWGPHMFASYFKSVRPEVRHVVSRYRLVDCAIKVVGVGSVGTRCAISLFVGSHPDDLLILQGKEASQSVLGRFLDYPCPDHQGQRVVQGQRLMQTASDFFLGWATNPDGDHAYIRHFRDWKGSVDVSVLNARGLSDYGELCAWTLAKAHARTGDRVAIAQHIGHRKMFAALMLDQSMKHAAFNDDDYTKLVESMARGEIASSDIY